MRALALPLLLFAVSCAAPAPPLGRYTAAAPKMGTTFRIVLYAPDPAAADAAFAAAWKRIDELDAALSDYDAASELSRLSALSSTPPAPPTAPTPVSADLWTLLVRSADLHERSGGAFDVTVGPYVRLWRRAFRQGVLPDPERLAAAARGVGFEHLRLFPESRSVVLDAPDMRLDLGGIAKGYALDQALAALAAGGIRSALVDGGGDVAVSGPPPGRPGWIVVLEHPEEAPRLQLAHAAVATSGDAYQHLELDGVRYSHLVDPATGVGLTHRTTVSVVAPDGTTADACASATSVMGAKRGLAWIESLPGLEARFTTLEKDGARPCQSTGFERMIAPPRDRPDPPSSAGDLQ